MEWSWKQSLSSHIRTPAWFTTLTAPLIWASAKWVSLCLSISSLSACQQPTGRAEMYCSSGHSLCITFPSAPPWLVVVSSSLFFLPDWVKSLAGYSRVSWKLLMLFLSLHAGPLVWTYHLLVLYSYNSHVANTHLHPKWVKANILYTECCTHHLLYRSSIWLFKHIIFLTNNSNQIYMIIILRNLL